MSDDPNFSNPYQGTEASADQTAAALENAATTAPSEAAAKEARPKKAKEKRDLTPKPENGLCLCGCGGYKRTKSAAFIPGHDAKLKSKIIKVQDEGVPRQSVAPEGWVYARNHWAHIFSSGVLDDNFVFVPKEKPAAEPAAATV